MFGRLQIASDGETDHAAKAMHVTAGDGVVGVRGQARAPDAFDARMLVQKFGNNLAAFVHLPHAQREGLQATDQQVGSHGPWQSAEHALVFP